MIGAALSTCSSGNALLCFAAVFLEIRSCAAKEINLLLLWRASSLADPCNQIGPIHPWCGISVVPGRCQAGDCISCVHGTVGVKVGKGECGIISQVLQLCYWGASPS